MALVVVVAVLLAIFLALFVYLGQRGLCAGCFESRPLVTLVLNWSDPSGADILVTAAQPPTPPSNYRWNIQIGSSYGEATNVATPAGTASMIRVDSANYTLAWRNPGRSGNLVLGDDFLVGYASGSGAPAAGTTITLYLLWTDGGTLTHITWQV